MRYWVSWKEPGEDSRPLKVPPPAEVAAWWESGIGEGYTTVCAVIDAGDEDDIPRILVGYWRPHSYRFVERKGRDWRPGARFPWPT